MFYYEDLSCPVCNKPFTAEDDIVVCPKCGLPHHRSCWNSIGRCFEEAHHGTAQQWSRERADEDAAAAAAEPSVTRTKACCHCGSMNTEYAEFCDSCGRAIESQDWQSSAAPQEEPTVREYTPYNWQYGSHQPSSAPIAGYAENELAAVVGNNAQYYIPRFRRIGAGGSGGWNWAAFFLGPFWLFYRKQFGLGWLYFAVMMLSNLSFAVAYAPVQFAETEAAYEAAMTALVESPIFVPVTLLTFVFLALKILLGIKGNDFYFGFCAKKIAAAKEKTPDLSVGEMTSLGGVSVGLAVLFYVLSSIAVEIVTIMCM